MTDFKTDEAGDLVISGGDLVYTDSTEQHQADIIYSEKGWLKFTPSLGVGLLQYVNETGTAPGLAGIIREELERDGMTVEAVSINQDGITINAKYRG